MKQVELGERIEGARFLGREFLVFMWWLSEMGDGTVDVRGHGELSLHLDASLVLERQAEGVESCRLKGLAPSSGREAKEALRDGKLPTKAHVSLSKAEQSYAFNFNADTLSTGGVRIPQLLTEVEDEAFFERMQLIEELESMLESLFEEFLRLRISSDFEASIAPAIRHWVREKPTMARAEYDRIRDRVLGPSKVSDRRA